MFLLPSVFVFVNGLLPSPLSAAQINILYFSVNLLTAVLIFREFLWRSVKKALEKPFLCLLVALIGYGVYWLAGLLLGLGILWIRPDFANVNDGTIVALSREHYALMGIATVFLVPVYEELFYRGLFFQGLHRKNRFLAYTVSVCVFAFIHIMGYVGIYDSVLLLLCFVQYLPAGIVLALAYEKTNTIVTPILLHILINFVGFLSMR